MQIELSPLDHRRFGVVTAKAALVAGDSPVAAAEWCRAHAVQLLIARAPAADIGVVQELEGQGAFLTDTLVHYTRKRLQPTDTSLPDGYCARLATAGDAAAVEALAGLSFAGYAGHYHADPRLPRSTSDLVYSDWAANSCRSTAVADAVIVIEAGGQLAAFATVKDRGASLVEGVLFGVHPAHQGRALYQALMEESQKWALARGFDSMTVSTQVVNLAVQKVWCRLGFEPSGSYYTLHQWFGEPA